MQNQSHYIVAVEIKRIVKTKLIFALLPFQLSCLGYSLPQVNFAAFLHGFVMVLCEIVAVDNTKGQNCTICNGSHLLWYCVKLRLLIIQRVIIVRFATDQEAIEKSKISCNKGFLPLLYCPLVCPNWFKCTFYHFCLLSIHWVIELFNPMQARIHIS